MAEDYADLSRCGHGRHEERRISLWSLDAPLPGVAAHWQSIGSIIRVQRRRRPSSPRSTTRSSAKWTTHYYISSRRELDARDFGLMIQTHWQIENRLHWVKDVLQNEDRNRINGGHAAENLSLLKTIAINLFRLHGHSSIKHATIRFANHIKELACFIL